MARTSALSDSGWYGCPGNCAGGGPSGNWTGGPPANRNAVGPRISIAPRTGANCSWIESVTGAPWSCGPRAGLVGGVLQQQVGRQQQRGDHVGRLAGVEQ